MAGNMQFQQDAFQAAEDAIDLAIGRRDYITDEVNPRTIAALGDANYDRWSQTQYLCKTLVPRGGFSIDEFESFHFETQADGRGPRNAPATHVQGFYVVASKLAYRLNRMPTMKRSIVAVMALLIGSLAGSVQALRVIEEVEGSVELALRDLTLPADATGAVAYRACATCTRETHAVTAATSYQLNGRPMPFVEFLAAIDEIRDMPSVEGRTLAGVFFDLNTQRVTRVIVRVSSEP